MNQNWRNVITGEGMRYKTCQSQLHSLLHRDYHLSFNYGWGMRKKNQKSQFLKRSLWSEEGTNLREEWSLF